MKLKDAEVAVSLKRKLIEHRRTLKQLAASNTAIYIDGDYERGELLNAAVPAMVAAVRKRIDSVVKAMREMGIEIDFDPYDTSEV